jgi:hypothetical protein
MFKRTVIKLCEKQIQEGANLAKDITSLPISKHIKGAYDSNQELLDSLQLPYELRGQYLPRRKINPFKKKPMSVIYDQSQFMPFVMPSKRQFVHAGFEYEKLFGIKRWRNDSPMMKEYITMDNQLCVLLIVLCLISSIFLRKRFKKHYEASKKYLLSNKAIFRSSDLI